MLTFRLKQGVLDRIAIGASMLCLIHCLALPLLIALLPAVALFAAIPESFHVWMFLLAVPTSIAALRLGFPKHRRLAPLKLAGAGLVLLGFGAIADITDVAETVVTIAGGVSLVLGHLLNGRRLRCPGKRP